VGRRAALLSLAVSAALAATAALERPLGVFWSLDQVGRWLQVQALLAGRFDLSLAYPGRALDTQLDFRPYFFSFVHDGAILVPWPATWALPSSLLFALLGERGLLVLPWLGGLLAAWTAGLLAERLASGSGWLAIALVGLASPLLIYSGLFWEHAPAAALFSLGVLLSLPEESPRRGRVVLAGACFGLAVAWRAEIALFLAVLLLARVVTLPRPGLAWLVRLGAGLALTSLPALLYTWLTTGSALPATPWRTASLAAVLEQALRHAPLALPDLLVGRNEFGQALPEPIRWSPVPGLLLLLSAWGRRGRLVTLARVGGLLLVGLPTAALFVTPAPGAVHGFLIAAPFLGLVLCMPGELRRVEAARWLLLFAALAVAAYALAAISANLRGLAAGGTEWGSRYLLPLYPPLGALAGATLMGLLRRRRWAEVASGGLLAMLALGFQFAGLAQIDNVLPQLRRYGELVGALPPGPVVAATNLAIRATPELLSRRAVYCAETPAALRRWTELAEAAGEPRLWLVDVGPLPASWLQPGAAAPSVLDTLTAGTLRASSYSVAALGAVLRNAGPDRETCGYRLLLLE
jgi:hypothetical protein